MGDIALLNLPAAGGVVFNAGDVDYITASDAVFYVNTNRPHRNIVYRTSVVSSKVNEILGVLNPSRGTLGTLDSRLDVCLNEDGTLKSSAQSDVTVLSRVEPTNLESRAQYMRSVAPSGFLPPHIDAFGNPLGLTATLGIGAVAFYPGGANDAVARSGFAQVTLQTPNNDVADSGHANNLYILDQPMKVNINGYVITLESRASKKANTVITLPAAPATGTRQDMVIIEAWKEEVEVGVADDCFFPFGNVQYKDSTVTMNGQAFTLSNTDHSGGNWPLYLATAAEHGYYVAGNDANIAKFIADPRNNVGMTTDGKYFQVRYRISTLPAHTPVVGYGTNLLTLNDGTNYFVPQGQKATRPAVAAKTNANGIFMRQDAGVLAAGTSADAGLLLGGVYSADAAKMTALSGLSLDGFVYAAPICLVHRRNQTAWSIAGNTNGAVAIGGTHTSPAKLAYNQVAERDVLDLRHRVSPSGWSDYRDIYEETLQALFKGNLRTSWKQLREDADGNLTMADLNIYGTKLMRAEGIKATSFDSSWDLCKISYCNNSIVADPDRLRNYYSDMPGEQIIYGRIPNVGADGASPNPVFAYTSAAHSLSMDATDLAANDGANSQRPQWSGRLPDLTWDDAPKFSVLVGSTNKVFFTYSGLTGDTITLTLQQASWVQLNITAATTLVVNDTYTLSGGCVVTVKAWNSAKTAVWGTFTGTTLPGNGGSTGHTGTGDASITVASNYIGYGSPTATGIIAAATYLGEGYDLHAGKAISINSYVAFKAGSGILRNMPYNEDYAAAAYNGLDSIKRCWYRINGTQVLPGDGQDFHPFGQTIDTDITIAGRPDTHTKSTCLVGFVRRGHCPGLDTLGSAHSIIKDSSTYKAWYAGTGGIRYATSSDGITWSGDQVVIPPNSLPGKDTNSVSGPCVIKDGSTYKIWYEGRASGGTVPSIIYATSTDGITWTGFTASNVVIGFQGTADTAWAGEPWVIKDGSTYRMWYSAQRSSDGVQSIVYCDSAGGVTFANATICLTGGAEGVYDAGNGGGYRRPCVIKDGVVYKMWVIMVRQSGNINRNGYVFSTDGKNWSRPRTLNYNRTEGTDTADTERTCVIKDDKAYKFWFVGGNGVTGNTYHGVFTMQDTANSGSSLVGVYGSTGTDNFAPGINDDVTIFYEARAMQQDFSDYAGTTPNITMDYILRYVPMEGVMTTLGTGAVPSTRYPLAYRDFLANLRPSEGLSTPDDSHYLSYLTGDSISFSGDTAQDDLAGLNWASQEQAWLDRVSTRLAKSYSVAAPLVEPRAGTLASLASLLAQTRNGGDVYQMWDADYTILGSGVELFPTPNIAATSVGGHCPFAAAVIEKNGALRMVGSGSPYASSGTPPAAGTITYEFNLVGRPLVKSS